MSEYKIRSQKRSRQSYAPYHTKKVSQSPRELPEGAPGAEGARTCWALNRVAPIHAVGGVNVFMASAGLSLVHCVRALVRLTSELSCALCVGELGGWAGGTSWEGVARAQF